jgi:integrase
MGYPEREFMLIGALSGLSPSEIIGLQWRHINLTTEDSSRRHLRVPAMTIAVRQRWYRGELDVVRRNSRRDVPICRRLLQILTELKSKSQFMGLSDFVLRSRVGTPVNYDNMMARRLLPIARRLGIPSISFHAFRWVQTVLGEELGEQFQAATKSHDNSEAQFARESAGN